MDLEEKIIIAALKVAGVHGLKFTMDELATALAMSKKTIYTVFADKESLLLAMADYVFDQIKEAEAAVEADSSLDSLEKLRRVLGAMPDSFYYLDFNQLSSLQYKYPRVYRRVNERVESEWELTVKIFAQAVADGLARDVDYRLVKLIYEAAIERFLNSDELKEMNISYIDALQFLVDLIVDGLVVRDEDGK